MFQPLSREDFQRRTEIPTSLLCPSWDGAEMVVSLRDIAKVSAISDMPKAYLRALIDNIPLASDPNVFPYRECKIDLVCCDPQHVRVGQTFVQSDKCLNLLSRFFKVFWDFAGKRGFADQTSKIILGEMANGMPVVAHYLPSIVEVHGETLILLDGVHRQFVARGVGANVETLFIRSLQTEFPAQWRHWKEIQLVDVKPPKEERFFNLKPELYRDLKAIGIDG